MKKKKKAKLKGTEEVSFIILRNYIPRQSWTLDSTKHFFFVFHLIDEERLYSI